LEHDIKVPSFLANSNSNCCSRGMIQMDSLFSKYQRRVTDEYCFGDHKL
jgi:hypothetical protein